MKTRTLVTVLTLCAIACATGCHGGPALSAWTTGEPNAPPDVAAVYSAVLDQIFPRGPNGPTLIVINQMVEATVVEIDTAVKRPHRRPDAIMAPFSYRIPLTFVDTASLRDLWVKSRTADSIANTVPMTDLRSRQRGAGPFMERYPGAWGRVTLGRVRFGPHRGNAAIEVRFASVVPGVNYGDEIFRLARTRNEWKVVKREPRDEAINPEPIPSGMLHAWVDSSLFPAPRRRLVRGTVSDSASRRPLSGIAIRIKSAPLGKHGEILRDRWPEPWGTLFTNAAGKFSVLNPPSGYEFIEAECPPTRGVQGAGLALVALEPESGLDTVLNVRVRFAACAELAPAMAAEVKRHLEDVKRAKLEAAARAVQGNLWGMVRDSRTAQPIRFVPVQIDGHWAGGSDSLGHFWLWGFAPGKRRITVYCPLRRQMGGRVATSFTLDARPAMKDTTDIHIDMDGCVDAPIDTVRVRTQGVWSTGFEDGFFTPCKRFNQIRLGAYRDYSGLAYLSFARSGIEPPAGWPDVKPEDGYRKTYLDVEGDLIGPGSYGHMGIAIYELKVTRILTAKAASRASCAQPGPDRNP
jgi:hypothetical protein